MKELLKDYDKGRVDVFIGYLKQLETEKKDNKVIAWWYKQIKAEQFVNAFKKVAATGLYIDGDSVTLNYRGKLIITYDYHAYKNKITITYPETIFDFEVVYEGDIFSFRKESGKVIYSHKIENPFKTDKTIIGAYGVIKNKRGEFIEIITKEDIDKMQNTSTMKNIWKAWYDRMVLKSIIKRICNVHFHDITSTIDEIDNETNEPDRATIDKLILDEIDNADTEDELGKIYKTNKSVVSDGEQFLKVLTKRKQEIKDGVLS